MEDQSELQKQHRNKLEKYTYYVIALCVSAIGFSIYITLDEPLDFSQIPLGLAVFSWSISIYCGLSVLQNELHHLNSNNDYLEVAHGKDPYIGNDISKQETGLKFLHDLMNDINKQGETKARWQNRLFYSGMLLFIIWHVMQMYSNT